MQAPHGRTVAELMEQLIETGPEGTATAFTAMLSPMPVPGRTSVTWFDGSSASTMPKVNLPSGPAAVATAQLGRASAAAGRSAVMTVATKDLAAYWPGPALPVDSRG